MKNTRVTKFNEAIDNAPKGTYSDDKDVIWKQLQLQAKLIKEEADEMYIAAMHKDIAEVLDGHIDTWVTNTYQQDLLEAIGVDVNKAREIILQNNECKYTTSREYAQDSLSVHLENGTDCHIHSLLTDDGEMLYTIKRIPDGKVLKMKDHEKVDLTGCIPKEWN